eukprot:3700450-Rhodomonas_salina.2
MREPAMRTLLALLSTQQSEGRAPLGRPHPTGGDRLGAQVPDAPNQGSIPARRVHGKMLKLANSGPGSRFACAPATQCPELTVRTMCCLCLRARCAMCDTGITHPIAL